MTAARPLQRHDLPEVAALYEQVARSGVRQASPWLEGAFARMLLDHPWVKPEISSLVVAEGDRIVGFIGANVRRLSVDGELRHGAWISQLTVDPACRGRGIGRLLLGEFLAQPQDLSFADGATEVTRYLWQRLGGDSSHLRCVEWLRPLRPWSLASSIWSDRRGDQRGFQTAAGALDRLTLAANRLAGGRLAGALSPPAPRYSAFEQAHRSGTVAIEPLTPASLVEHLPAVAEHWRMHPAYDLPFTQWLFEEIESQGRGRLVARIVRLDTAVMGWFIYQLRPGARSPVLQIAARDEAAAAVVVDALIDDAGAGGAAAVHGRVEPLLLRAVTARGVLLRYAGQATLHTRDPALAGVALSRAALLTRLDGAWWMTPHVT